MLNKKAILCWLRTCLNSWPIIEAHVFGSITSTRETLPADVDLFIKYNHDNMAKVFELKKLAEREFFVIFGCRLHLLVLSENEAYEFEDFLKASLKNSEIVFPA